MKKILLYQIASIIIAFSVFYYFVVFLPAQSKKESEYRATQDKAREEEKCISSADSYRNELESRSRQELVYMANEYIYNSDSAVLAATHTSPKTSCFILVIVLEGDQQYSSIQNVYTREFILSISYTKGRVSSGNQNVFSSMSNLIFRD